MDAAGVRQQLSLFGLLLLADARLPSVTTLVAGEIVRGSWWSHPCGAAIYAASHALAHDRDVLAVKLIDGKVTFLHRRLWPALLAVSGDNAPGGLTGLSEAAASFRRRVLRAGALSTDAVPRTRWRYRTSVTRAAGELLTRLLLHGEEVHTEHGAHALVLQSWERWRNRRCPGLVAPPAAEARQVLEQAVAALPGAEAVRVRLPWQASVRRARTAPG